MSPSTITTVSASDYKDATRHVGSPAISRDFESHLMPRVLRSRPFGRQCRHLHSEILVSNDLVVIWVVISRSGTLEAKPFALEPDRGHFIQCTLDLSDIFLMHFQSVIRALFDSCQDFILMKQNIL